jgi:HlyD family secretion protein
VVAGANLANAGAKLTEVRAGTKRADADLARWQAEFKRVEQLFNEHAQTGSLVDETRSKLRASESTRDEVYAQVKSAESADVGDLTEPGSHGEPLFIVARDDIVRITVSVPEMFATEVETGDRVLIRLQALSGRDFEAKVTRTSWMLDAKNRTLRTEIDVPNRKGVLRPGLYAHATIVVEEHAGVLSVPTSALVRTDSNTYCVAVTGGEAIREPVTVGLDDGTRAEILSGLSGEEQIVKAYASSLVDGQRVEILPPPRQ